MSISSFSSSCRTLLWMTLLGTLLPACSRNYSEAQEEPSAATPAVRSDQPGELRFSPPEEWIRETPSSTMRHAQFRLQRVSGDSEDGELVIFFFGGQGGSVQDNINRWVSQFSPPEGSVSPPAETSELLVNGLKITLLDVSGTYTPAQGPMMTPGTPKPDYRMLAAIVETTVGPWFLRLTGPARTVERWRPDWLEFLNTLRFESGNAG